MVMHVNMRRTRRGRNVRGFRVTGRVGLIRANLIVAPLGRMMVSGSFTTPTPKSSAMLEELQRVPESLREPSENGSREDLALLSSFSISAFATPALAFRKLHRELFRVSDFRRHLQVAFRAFSII